MATIKMLRILHLAAYVVIASQLMYYVLVMGDALKLVPIEHFLAQRKIVDPLVHKRHIPFYYLLLALSIILLVILFRQWNTLPYITLAIATLMLLTDVFLSLKFNVPINNQVNHAGNLLAGLNWVDLRLKWILFIKIRAVVIMLGLAVLLAGVVSFRK